MEEEKSFTHLNKEGKPQMVNVGAKKVTTRTAHAQSIVIVGDEIIAQFKGNDIQTKKGPVFHTAVIAGTMAAKKTGELIPLCHPLGLDSCSIDIHIDQNDRIIIDCICSLHAKTGVEMEALTGASVAALTIYDMCKAFSHNISIEQTRLMSKTGGKQDFHRKQ